MKKTIFRKSLAQLMRVAMQYAPHTFAFLLEQSWPYGSTPPAPPMGQN